MKVSIIGSGNVAWHFAARLSEKDTEIEIVHRSPLSNVFHGINCSNSSELNPDAELVIMAVSDRSIKEVANTYSIPEKSVIVHCSGSVGIEVFSQSGNKSYGVLYPLQSLTAGIEVREMPILVEGNSDRIASMLCDFARTISSNVQQVGSPERRKMHAAAVFASNFVNHLLGVSSEILDGIPLSVLQPLILTTVDKALSIGPKKAQTGPAIRRDTETMGLHEQLIEEELHLELYKMISDHIQKTEAP